MMRLTVLCVLIQLVALPAMYADPMEVAEVTVAATHRVYQDYREVHKVKLGDRFILSDTEYSAEIQEFIPDFAINIETREIISRSDEPKNPAIRVAVFKADKKVDEVWAFKGAGAPHFSRESFLAFELLEFKAKTSSSPQSSNKTELHGETPIKDDDTGENKEDSEE